MGWEDVVTVQPDSIELKRRKGLGIRDAEGGRKIADIRGGMGIDIYRGESERKLVE
jgi:hypothetical protein